MWSPSTAVAEKTAAVGRIAANSKSPWPWNVEKANAERSSGVGLLIPPLASGITPQKRSSSCLPLTNTSGQVVGCSPPVAKSWRSSAGSVIESAVAAAPRRKTPCPAAPRNQWPPPILRAGRGALQVLREIPTKKARLRLGQARQAPVLAPPDTSIPAESCRQPLPHGAGSSGCEQSSRNHVGHYSGSALTH